MCITMYCIYVLVAIVEFHTNLCLIKFVRFECLICLSLSTQALRICAQNVFHARTIIYLPNIVHKQTLAETLAYIEHSMRRICCVPNIIYNASFADVH